MKLKLLMGMSDVKFGLLWDQVLYDPYAHALDSDSLKDTFVSCTQRSIQTPQSTEVITVYSLL